jgi:hypothetical protein
MTFCAAKLPHTGLANRLFPWARCKLFSLASGSPMLAPRWEQIKLGPILRGESDWRFYGGLFQAAPEEITGIRRQWLTTTVASIPEPVRGVNGTSATLPERAIVEFSDLRDHFEPLHGHRAVILQELEKIVRPRWRHAAAVTPLEPIGLHVRRGDFAVAATPDDLRTRGSMQTPISWFVATLGSVRRELGFVAPAFVVSDGRPAELAELLSMPSVRLIDTQSAISDLLLLARARLLLASGGSSFSAWASYLGSIPTVSIPGQNLDWYKLRHENGAFVGEAGDGEIAPPLRAQLATLGGQLVNQRF